MKIEKLKLGGRDAVDLGDPERDGDPARKGETPSTTPFQDSEGEWGRFQKDLVNSCANCVCRW